MNRLSRLFIYLVLGVSTLICSSPAYALTAADYIDNEILFYQKGAPASCSTGSTLEGSTNKIKIWNFLISKGLSAEQAAGVMGNIQVESSFNPSVEERTSRAEKGYGIVQWTFGRRTALENAAQAQGVPVDDLGFQLEFMYQESMGRKVSSTVANQGYGERGAIEWETLKQQTSIMDAVVFWHNNFEVSAQTPQQVINSRGGAAQSIFDELSGSTTRSSSSSNTCVSPGTDSATTNSILQTIQLLAWPYSTKGKSMNTDAKPEYQQAAATYFAGVGYGPQTLADCTYFVAIVMRKSGADSEFPIGTTTIRSYLEANTDKYELIRNPTREDLKPGDILQHLQGGANYSGHILFYTGDLDGAGKYDSADASKYTRVPGYTNVDGMFGKRDLILARLKSA